MAAEAIAAVDGTRASRDKQYAASVFLEQAGVQSRGIIADGIGHEAGHLGKFFSQRQDLSQQWIGGVAAAHASDKSARGKEGELPCGSPCRFGEIGRQIEQAAQFGRIANGVFHGFLPRGIQRPQSGADNAPWQGYNSHSFFWGNWDGERRCKYVMKLTFSEPLGWQALKRRGEFAGRRPRLSQSLRACHPLPLRSYIPDQL